MKKSLLATAAAGLFLAHTAFAADPGVYLGVNLGYGKVNQTVSGAAKQDNTGVAFAGNVGYNLSQNFAVEAGFNHFADQDYGNNVKGKNNYSFDLAAKGTLPLQNGFNAFGKLGLAAVHHTINGVTNSGSFTRPAALLGAGVGYDINQSVGVNAQFTATTKNGPVPAMYMGTAGLTFNIG